MAWRPSKKCKTCSEIAIQGSAYCQKHKQEAEQQWDSRRRKAHERGYNHLWSKVKEMKAQRNPLCEDCEAEGITKPLDMVHHMDGNSRHNEMENLRSLCWFHHGKYHGADKE